MKRKLKWFALMAVVLAVVLALVYANNRYEIVALHPFSGSQESDVKVMTWNVHCGARPSDARQEAIADVVLREDADVVALIEFNLDSCQVLDSLLRTKYKYAEEEYAKWVPGDIIYSKTENHNSGHRTIPILGKAVHNIAMTVAVCGDSVYVMAVHLNSNNDSTSYKLSPFERVFDYKNALARYCKAQEDRTFSAGYIGDWAKESVHPMIVMGDMNDFSCSEPLRVMYEGGLRNCWTEGGFGLGNTYQSGWLGLRIDHILHTDKLRLTDVRVLDTGELSDHRPVVARFRIIRK